MLSRSQGANSVIAVHGRDATLEASRAYHSTASGYITVPSSVNGDTLDFSSAVRDEGKYTPVTDLFEFHAAATRTLERLARSVEAMKEVNDPFEVHLAKYHDLLIVHLGSHHGDPSAGGVKCTLEIDDVHKCISMSSPHTGGHNYFLCKDTGEWLDINDHHTLEGTFVRDLNHLCKGLPKL